MTIKSTSLAVVTVKWLRMKSLALVVPTSVVPSVDKVRLVRADLRPLKPTTLNNISTEWDIRDRLLAACPTRLGLRFLADLAVSMLLDNAFVNASMKSSSTLPKKRLLEDSLKASSPIRTPRATVTFSAESQELQVLPECSPLS